MLRGVRGPTASGMTRRAFLRGAADWTSAAAAWPDCFSEGHTLSHSDASVDVDHNHTSARSDFIKCNVVSRHPNTMDQYNINLHVDIGDTQNCLQRKAAESVFRKRISRRRNFCE